MGTSPIGTIVLVRFPFSDLTNAKLRPALVLADVGRNDSILCQITSNPFGDKNTIKLTENNFISGSLDRISYARPGRLFTANKNIISREVGKLKSDTHAKIVSAIILILKKYSISHS